MDNATAGVPSATGAGDNSGASGLDVASMTSADGTTTDGDGACAAQSNQADNAPRPVDIIFVIDNSGSMSEEISAVQDRINQDFATIIGSADIDYRVIFVTRYGQVGVGVGGSDNPVCISTPLSGSDCATPMDVPPQNTERFFHYSADIESRDGLCKFVQGIYTSDELGNGGDARNFNWAPLAPGGFGAWLREGSVKHIVMITDDIPDCQINDVPGGAGMGRFDTTLAGAQAFDQTIRTLAPEHFGDPIDVQPGYHFHSIIALEPTLDAATGLPIAIPPDAPVVGANGDGIESVCSVPVSGTAATTGAGGAAGMGAGGAPAMMTPEQTATNGPDGRSEDQEAIGYQELSRLSGGLRFPSCYTDNFDAVFQALAEGVIDSAPLPCEWNIPTLERDEVFDPDKVNLTFTRATGEEISGGRVDDSAQCGLWGWYYDNPEDPNQVMACPQTCDALRADLMITPEAEVIVGVDVQFGCATVIF